MNLADVHAKVEFLKLINGKIAWGVDKGVSPADASATKVFGTELYIEACRKLMECFGQEAYVEQAARPGAKLKGPIERMYKGTLILTFGGGTNEIQRDLIAMVGLGRTPGASRDEPDGLQLQRRAARRSRALAHRILGDKVTEDLLAPGRGRRRTGSTPACGPSWARPACSASPSPRTWAGVGAG